MYKNKMSGQGTLEFVGPFLLFLVGVFILCALLGPALSGLISEATMRAGDYEIDLDSSHGSDRHPGDAEAVRDCLRKNGYVWDFVNSATGRHGLCVKTEDGKLGTQIIEPEEGGIWREITAFFKNKFSKDSQLFKYMENSGYDQVK